jgi:EcsC protein family
MSVVQRTVRGIGFNTVRQFLAVFVPRPRHSHRDRAFFRKKLRDGEALPAPLPCGMEGTMTPEPHTPRSVKATTALATIAGPAGLAGRIEDAILDLAGAVPTTDEPLSPTPHARAQALARSAAKSAAGLSGTAALAPGPFGLLTLLPDLVLVWKVQARLVADIAAAYGQSASLGKEQMLYCLFKHAAAQAFRDLVVRTGERFIVRRAGVMLLQSLASKIGLQIAQRTVGKAAARYLPLVGAAGVAGYAYYDTRKVADNAIALFSRPVTLEHP